MPQDDIVALLELDPETLRKHLRHELGRGPIEATPQVGQSLSAWPPNGRSAERPFSG